MCSWVNLLLYCMLAGCDRPASYDWVSPSASPLSRLSKPAVCTQVHWPSFAPSLGITTPQLCPTHSTWLAIRVCPVALIVLCHSRVWAGPLCRPASQCPASSRWGSLAYAQSFVMNSILGLGGVSPACAQQYPPHSLQVATLRVDTAKFC